MNQEAKADRIANALTIDVEDYFQVSAFAPHIERSAWEITPCRIERNIDRILDLLNQSGAKATFFTLGWLAQRYPRLVRDISSQGHEVASHGQAHLRASDQLPAEFDNDIRAAKHLLEDTAGVAVRGYRAPSFSIGHGNLWAFDRIAAAGYSYSSSVYPVQHDHYGMPDAPRFPYRPSAALLEIPVSTARVFGRNLPAGGGGYFRLVPYALSRWAINRVNHIDRRPAIFYFHPWEIDPQQPRIKGLGLKTRFRHYVNLNQTEPRLRRLLSDFRWERVDRVFDLNAA
ncbi:MAG TPA: XrtA system polysaccharide deacetylase [Burkholderiaceae bacterium]|jgi:polysaccharide deacetylase family protein (PEP-CTERM system associated)|nr:XrtA system polysaccharide deacetylase [Burkholderiaceae bacterium]